MRIPIIKVNGRIVGTNSHDCLYINDNAIHYLSTQCMCGSQDYPDDFKFEGKEPDEYSFTAHPEIEFMELEDVIELAIQLCKDGTEKKIRLHEIAGIMLEEYKATKKECTKKLKGCVDTSGILL